MTVQEKNESLRMFIENMILNGPIEKQECNIRILSKDIKRNVDIDDKVDEPWELPEELAGKTIILQEVTYQDDSGERYIIEEIKIEQTEESRKEKKPVFLLSGKGVRKYKTGTPVFVDLNSIIKGYIS